MHFLVTFWNHCLYIGSDADICVSSHHVHEVGMIEIITTKSGLAMGRQKGRKMKSYRVFVLPVVLALTACAGGTGPQSRAMPDSGGAAAFFSNSSAFKGQANGYGAFRYTSPTLKEDRKQIRSLFVAPVEVWLDPLSEYKGLSADDIAGLTKGFRKALLQDTDRQYPLVNVPAQDSLVVRVALTGVRLKKARFKLLSLTPVGLVVQGVKAVSGVSPVSIDRVGIQVEGTLGESGKVLFAIRKPAATSLLKAGQRSSTRLDEIPDELDALAKKLRTELDELAHK